MPGLETHVFDITRVIQLAIAPVFLLSAIATLINVLITRLSRAVDRRRVLEEHLSIYQDEHLQQAILELRMLQKRITLVLWSVTLAVLASLLICLLVGTAFAGAYIAMDLSHPVAGLFVAAIVAFTGCLLLFLREISVAAFSARQTVSPYAARVVFK
ncbi:MAG: DUF2721 domain-containing protein [Burkholderiales bacterium]|nr:DUF2721 domain-containing protein [Burkholderiales bacterium]